MKIVGLLTSAIAWFVKNVNMIVGIIGAVGKLACGILNIFQPDKDALVDKIEEWTEVIQEKLFEISQILKKFAG